MSRRLFTACLGTETNSFSPIPTGMRLFENTMLVRDGQHGERVNLFGLPLQVWRERAEAKGWRVTEGLAAFAVPAGDTTRSTHESLRDEIIANLKAAMPVDAVLLNLHGAMIADGYPDAEGDLLTAVRALVGPNVPVLAELDLHGHMTRAKFDACDAMIYFKEYPHIDAVERAHEVFDLAERMLEDGLRPTMAMHDCRMLGIYPTTREPMISFVARMQALEKQPGVLSVSLIHGFPWGDTPEVGTRVLVVTDNDPALAAQTARELGTWVWEQRDALLAPFVTLEKAIETVVAAEPSTAPFVLADTADNTGIGAAGDSTWVLSHLIESGAGGFAISPMWDPNSVQMAVEAGQGARIPIRLGGKLGPASGPAVDAMVTVMGLVEDATQPFGGSTAPLGNMAWLRIGDDISDDASAIDVIVNSNRIQAFAPECFSAVGLDPTRPKALIVKSTQHFFAGFGPIARDVIYMATPGTGSMDFASLPHTRVDASLWPKVANPHDA
ncbi:MAG: M81 family metallopeptidase [Burkholderiaceae bacterium]